MQLTDIKAYRFTHHISLFFFSHYFSHIINFKYYNIDVIQTLNKLNHKGVLCLFHINTFSLPKNIEDLEYLINERKIEFDVIAFSEPRIIKNRFPISDINLKNCSYEACTTDPSAGGTHLFISNHLFYKYRSDLCNCKFR